MKNNDRMNRIIDDNGDNDSDNIGIKIYLFWNH